MPRQNIGHILRARREELGISLDMAATATNVRARMLEDIETGDYANFPPYGYSMGIISSYARYLRIDPRPLLEHFEQDYSSYEFDEHVSASAENTRRGVGRFGEKVNPTDKPLSRETRPKKTGAFRRKETGNTGNINNKLDHEQFAEHDDRYKSGSVRVIGTRQTGSFSSVRARGSYRDRTRSQNEESRSTGTRRTRSRFSNQERSTNASTTGTFEASSYRRDRKDNSSDSSFSTKRSRSRQRRRQMLEEQNNQSGSLLSRISSSVKEIFSETRTRAIAIIALVFVLLVIITAAVLISTAGNDNANVIDVEGGAQDTTTTSTNSNSASATITTVNGNTVKVGIDVAEGQTSLVTVTFDDDNAYSGAAVGPWHQEFIVTESFSATFGNPDAVTVTENGNEVEIQKESDGTGSLTLNIETTSTTDSSTEENSSE